MSAVTKVGIAGAGWPGQKHAEGYRGAGGFQLAAVADLIPDRRAKMKTAYGIPTEYNDASELIKDKSIDVISVCLPNHLHAPIALAALRAGKHVVIEAPPALTAAEAKKIDAAAAKSGKLVMYAHQRRFGPAELAAKQTIDKGYAGDVYHARAVWTRTRGVPMGTGWYTDKQKSGGGAMIDLGTHLLDLAWYLIGEPKPLSAFAVTHQKHKSLVPETNTHDVEDAAFALIKCEGNKSIEIATCWAANQPPSQNGTVCRLYGDLGSVEVYTPTGAILYRGFNEQGTNKAVPLKPPKVGGHIALMRHFRQCLLGKSLPMIGAVQGVSLMQMIDAIYKSAATGKSADIK